MPYYDRHPFTDAQALHAARRVLYLIRIRRFFLHNAGERHAFREEDYTLHPEVFAEAIALNEAHITAHRTARGRAQDEIEQFEAENGIIMPSIPRGKSVVEFSRYGGGFEICRVYPLAAFAEFVPKDIDSLALALLQMRLGHQTQDDVVPKLYRDYSNQSVELAKIIWVQLQQIDAVNPENNRCMVLMQSRIRLDEPDRKSDFADGRVSDMQDFAFAVGFLFYEYSRVRRIVQHNHVVCSTSCNSHVRIEHWSDAEGIMGNLSINFDAKGGYTDKVMFATVL